MLETELRAEAAQTVKFCPLCCFIPLTKGKVAFVDPEDWVSINRKSWRAKLSRGGWYAYRKVYTKNKVSYVYLHRLIMNTPKGRECHHGNGNGLDDRKGNLENLTPHEHGQLSKMLRIAKKRNFCA